MRRRNAREDLLATGRALFSQKGFDATSTREIAAAAGCNLALINHYFGSKEGLLVAILESEIGQGAPDFFAVLKGPGSAADQLARFIDLGIDHFADDGEFLRIVHRELIGSARGSLRNLIAPIERVIGELTKRFEEIGHGGLGDLDPRMTAVLLVGAMQYYFVSYPLTSKLLGAESDSLKTALKRHITALFVGGFAARPIRPVDAPLKDRTPSGDSAAKRRRKRTEAK
jgi:AcrR family transcriptional regulator